jgi:hypothetical protein
MNKTQINSWIQYLIIIVITVVLVWFAVSNIETGKEESKLDFLLEVWNGVDKGLLVLSGVVALLSHVVRAERWKLSFQPMGLHISLKHSFLSVMVGYFINLLIPRGGEISRCVNLNRLDSIPVDRSFGTVLAERAVDIVFLVFFVLLGFLLEFSKINLFLSSLQYDKSKDWSLIIKYVLLLVFALIDGIIFLRLLLKSGKPRVLRTYIKFKTIMKGIKEGLMVVIRLKQKSLFLFYTVIIWLLYLFMSVFVLMAFEETQHLGFVAALAIFSIGGIAMSLPLPGGTGSYHILVPAGLVALYSIPLDKATAFTIIFHGWQTIIIIIFGAGSLFYSYYLHNKKRRWNP